jgi:hypothetical protein
MPWPHDPGPHWGEVGIHGLHRQREWDAVGSVSAPGEPGAEVVLVALEDGRVVREHGAAADLEVLAGALRLDRPFRARAVRRDDGAWAVAGSRIEVVALRAADDGAVVEVVWDGIERTTTVDGEPTFERFAALETLGSDRFATYVARAERLAGDLWEVSILPL